MAIRVRKDGTMWCAAHTEPMEGDTYIDDGEHYYLSVERGLLVALPMPEHVGHCQWWWANAAPPEADRKFVKPNRIEGVHMARTLDQITEAEIEAAADVMLTPVAAPDPGPKHKWRAMKDQDIIAHQEVGDLVARMIRAAELAREG